MNIDYKVWLVALVLVAIVLILGFWNHEGDDKEEITLRTLSVKNHAQRDAINQQMAVFLYQLGMWLKSNQCDGIFSVNEGLCYNLKLWVTVHKKSLESLYPGLSQNLRQQFAADLRKYMGSIKDPFLDIAKPSYQNLDRLNYIRFIQQKYNVHPDARI